MYGYDILLWWSLSQRQRQSLSQRPFPLFIQIVVAYFVGWPSLSFHNKVFHSLHSETDAREIDFHWGNVTVRLWTAHSYIVNKCVSQRIEYIFSKMPFLLRKSHIKDNWTWDAQICEQTFQKMHFQLVCMLVLFLSTLLCPSNTLHLSSKKKTHYFNCQ